MTGQEDLAQGFTQMQGVDPSNQASEPGMRGTLKHTSKGPANRDVWGWRGVGGSNTRKHAGEGDETPNNPTCPSPHGQRNIPWFPEPPSVKGLTVLGEEGRKTEQPQALWPHKQSLCAYCVLAMCWVVR